MRLETLIGLLVFLLPLAYSPGPGNAFFAAVGASNGTRATVPALAGYHAATFGVTVLIGFGIGATAFEHPEFTRILSAAGGIYILWLALGFIRAARTSAEPKGDLEPKKEKNIGFWAGAMVLLLNPKAYYIIAAMFTQFLHPSEDNATKVVAIALVFTLNNLLAFTVWVLGGRTLTVLFQNERARRWIDYLFAASLIGVAAWMALPLFT
ncbi:MULTISPECIES: LysE family translocator [Nocardiopsis]|uniref:Lysine transporter LysE n=1 Tax=Nocardiopsis sinuspersici TaxID=501010 RepID=A0A1V3C0A0_9ACTN|nr:MULTISPECIES: LysE family translocator [Nocardiopsis]OOC54108.1 lysine transporter LysE [Nocardiopsis sinuspersici]